MAVEGGDDYVLDVVAVYVDQGGRCQHSLHLVCVDGHSLEKCHNNVCISLKKLCCFGRIQKLDILGTHLCQVSFVQIN